MARGPQVPRPDPPLEAGKRLRQARFLDVRPGRDPPAGQQLSRQVRALHRPRPAQRRSRTEALAALPTRMARVVRGRIKRGDRAVGDGEALGAEQGAELGLAPHRKVAAQALEGADQLHWPSRDTAALRSARAKDRLPGPAVEGAERRPDDPGGLRGRATVGPRLMPSGERVAPDRLVCLRRRVQERRKPGPL